MNTETLSILIMKSYIGRYDVHLILIYWNDSRNDVKKLINSSLMENANNTSFMQ